MEYEYEVIDHGIENPQYFQGCGTTFTIYEWCQTGIGDSFNEALEDALDSIGSLNTYEDIMGRPTGFNFEKFNRQVIEENLRNERENRLTSISRIYAFEIANNEDVNMYYHVSIRYNIDTKKRESSEHTGFDNYSE